MWINWRLVGIWAGFSALGIAVLVLAGCNKVKPGWSIEAPPRQYASGPTQTGHTTEVPNLTPEQANYLCHVAGVWAHEPSGFPVACYNARTDQVILPAQWPSGSELDQMRAHEWAHARGWRHNDDGTGTSLASLPPVGQHPATEHAENGGLATPPPSQAVDPAVQAGTPAIDAPQMKRGGAISYPLLLAFLAHHALGRYGARPAVR